MASDDERKKEADRVLLDTIIGDDEEAWDAAIDEWDMALDSIGEDGPAPDPHRPATGEQATAEGGEVVDPLMDFIQGEIEISDQGEALGSLLGSPEPPTPEEVEPASADPLEHAVDIGIHPDQVTRADGEVEVAVGEWQDDDYTPVVDLMDLPKEQIKPIIEDEEFGTGGLLGEAEEKTHPPLEVFDEIVPPREEPVHFETIEVGEVLPEREEPVEEPRPSTIPLDLDAEALEEPSLEPPPIPEHLSNVDVLSIDMPERSEPLSPPKLYWERLSEHLQLEASLSESAAHAAAMEYTVARALEEIDEQEDAILHYHEVLSHQPGHAPALRDLRRVHTARREADRTVLILEELATRVGEQEARALMYTQADLLWCSCRDDAGARSILDKLQEPATENMRGVLLKADLAAATGDEEELEAALKTLASLVEEPVSKASLLVQQGRFSESQQRFVEAKQLYQEALDLSPDCTGAVEGLIRSAVAAEDFSVAAEAMVLGLPKTGIWSGRRLRRSATLAINGKAEKVDAVAALKEARSRSQEDPLILEDLAHSLRVSGDASGAVAAFVTLAEMAADEEQRGVAQLEAGLLSEDALQDTERARELVEQAAARLPTSLSVDNCLQRLKLLSPDAALRAEAHQAAASSRKGKERAVHHLFAALALERELNLDSDAARQLIECLEHDPLCWLALVRLELIYRKTGQHENLAAALDTVAEAAETPAVTTDLRTRAALLYEGPLEKPDLAKNRYSQIVEVDSEHALARWGAQRCLGRMKQWNELAEELAKEATFDYEPRHKARLWTACGDLHWGMGRHQEAESSYRAALELSGDYIPPAWNLGLDLAQQGRWSDLADIWTTMIGSMDEDAPQRKSLLMRVGALQEFELNEFSSAQSSYASAQAEPHPTPGALEGHLRTLRQLNQMEKLVRELERELEMTSDPATRFAILVAAGDLAQRADIEWSEASQRYRKALREIPHHPVARRALERLHLTHQAWLPYADLLMEDLKAASTDEHRARIYERLALMDVRRGDLDSARLSFDSIMNLTPGHLGATTFIQHSLVREEKLDNLLIHLRREAKQCQSSSDSAALWIELGRLLSVHPPSGDESQNARTAYETALESDPNSTFVLQRLLDLASQDHDLEQQARLYTKLASVVEPGSESAIYLARAGEFRGDSDLGCYQEALEHSSGCMGAIFRLRDAALRTGDWESAIHAAEFAARECIDPGHQIFAASLAAEIALLKLEDRQRAMNAYRLVLKADPSHRQAYVQLRSNLQSEEKWQELAQLLAARAKVERSHAALVEIHRDLAMLAGDHLDDRDSAKKHLRILLKLKKDDPQALKVIADLYQGDHQWSEAANALIRIARQEEDPKALAGLFMRLGQIYQDKAPDTDRAIASFRKVITLDPDNLEALQRVSDLYLKAKDFEHALSYASVLLESEQDRALRVQHLLKIAKIHEEGFSDAHKAAVSFRQALELAPTDLEAIGEVISFFTRQGDQRSLMIHLDTSVATMRNLLKHNAFDPHAHHSLFHIFGWRKSTDGRFCAAQALEAIGRAEREERQFLDMHLAAVGAPGAALGDPEHDERLFVRSIPGGFRQVFRLLSDSFAKYYPGDRQAHGVGRSDRVANIDHPLRRIGDSLAKDFGVETYELYALPSKPNALVVENTDPPSILIGKALFNDATKEELTFLMARSMWLIAKSMVLPAKLRPQELALLVSAIVRQYNPEFDPGQTETKALQDATRKIARAIPRKLRQELMPFALECSGNSDELKALGSAVIHSANRAGLIASRSIYGALTALCKLAGTAQPPQDASRRVALLHGNIEAEELMRFSVSDAYFAIRRGMHIAIT